jgi:GT2 family glycosyltransferase
MPNRDNAPLLDLVLDRLAANTGYPDFELLVVDDGSTDGSLEILRRWRDSGRFEEFELIERPHGGVVEALNAGLEAATGELVVQLDADATVETPGWLERMVGFVQADERVGAVTAKVVFDHGEIHACGIEVVGPEGLHDRGTRITETAGQREYHQRVLRPREGECDACERPAEVDGGIGCCMIYRRDAALAAGGYDPGFAPVWFDDLDLTLSLRKNGQKVFFLPDVRVVHHLGGRGGDRSARRGVARVLKASARRLLPERAGIRAVRAMRLDRAPREHRDRLAHHYAYWREKWGFDMLNPDMDEVRARWGDTEVCWRTSPERRAAGEEIVAAYEAARRAPC